ncbi:class I SAM-dependent methyltransferase [Dyadobacter sp. CY261]|uniref:class I SAM-dependent methyltransferase n=1 Tax=Dyadobacter sp. CY261 TaxID=2907203 RepID=UPI001F2CF88A|nr:class I SAM-dependent methyltransferase [Dyadobacter sp. CY261]MCF0075717.1 class I SAM-dependent methyltransferase [Dyadobacter sp. CY261]
MKRAILRKLKRNRLINGARRVLYATSYFNRKYFEILKWGFESKEDTNYTYELKEGNIRYLAQLIAAVTGEPYSVVLGYIQEAQNDKEVEDHVLDAIKRSPYTAFADFRTGFAKRLGWYALVRILKPQVVVETGIDKGLGAVLLCAGLLKNRAEGFEGEYYGTDINPEAGYLLTGKYKEVGSILFGDSIKSLQSFDKQIDLFINDSDHSATYEYNEYLTVKPILSSNAVILGDNSHVTDKLSQFAIENSRDFVFFKEEPKDHWYPGGGIGICYTKDSFRKV